MVPYDPVRRKDAPPAHPLRARRFQRQALDLPVLLHPQPLPLITPPSARPTSWRSSSPPTPPSSTPSSAPRRRLLPTSSSWTCPYRGGAAGAQACIQALSLPENALVGLVTFGTHVHVHELGFADCPKSYVFRGSKEFTSQQIQDQLFAGNRHRLSAQQQAHAGEHRAAPRALADCEFWLSAVLEDLSRDSFAALPDCRPARTGTAVAVAATLLSSSVAARPARALLFVGGAATDGGGQVSERTSNRRCARTKTSPRTPRRSCARRPSITRRSPPS